MCPAAEVSLYTYHNPGEEVSQAVSLNGRLYTELPTAFSYRKAINPACSCRRPGESWAEALKANGTDETVAPGDVIVTEQNAKQLSQPRIGADGKPIRPALRAQGSRARAGLDRGSAGRDRSGQAQSAHGRPDFPAGAVDFHCYCHGADERNAFSLRFVIRQRDLTGGLDEQSCASVDVHLQTWGWRAFEHPRQLAEPGRLPRRASHFRIAMHSACATAPHRGS